MSVKSAANVRADVVGAGKGTTRQVLIGPDEGPNFALRRFIIEPGGGMPPHTTTVEHEQYIHRGRARIGVGDHEVDVSRDDVVFIPAGTPHWYKVLGEAPFEFLCVVPNGPDRIEVLEDSSADPGC